MAGPAPVAQTDAVLVLEAALDPVKDYRREAPATEEATSQTPLTRVVDAVNPESAVSRRFSQKVDQFVASSCKDAAIAADLRTQLTQWARNDEGVQLAAQQSFLVKEAAPASMSFSQAAQLALTALDRISQGLPSPDDLKKQQTDALNAFEAQANKSQLTIPSLPAFQKLIEAAGTGGACVASK
jgi:hypothetical protein